jgi:NADP-dependent 3-hydroxy acid dehydrogenase YdfG
MPEIRNQNIVVTGAAGDMGRAIVDMLAGQGARVAIADRDAARLADLEKSLRDRGVHVFAQVVDVTEEEQVAGFFAAAKQSLGRFDVLLNLPGLSIPGQIAAAAVADFDRMFDVNVKGAFLCAKQFVGHVDEKAGALVVNISSVAAKRANANAPLYCAAKAAVSMLADGLALQVAAKNVRVTTLSPGAANTQFWGTRAVPRDKFLKVEEIVEVIRFVLSMPQRVVFHDVVFESFDFWRSK